MPDTLDPFDLALRDRLAAAESAIPVAAPVAHAPARPRILRPRRVVALAGVLAAALAIAVSLGARPAATDARTFSLDAGITVTARTTAVWAGTVDRATAESRLAAFWAPKIGADATVTVTRSWQVPGTLSVAGTDWSASWAGPSMHPFDAWVVEGTGTMADGTPFTVSLVLDADTDTPMGGGLSQPGVGPGPTK
jgi:hypothetical protein